MPITAVADWRASYARRMKLVDCRPDDESTSHKLQHEATGNR